MSYSENTKPQKSDYTNRSMKQKGVYEAHEMTREHGYLGEARNHLEPGYIHGGKIERRTQGTSKVLNDEAGVVPKKGTDEKY